MNPSQRRLLVLGVCHAAALVVVAGHLTFTMVGQHELWLERSYENRWAFRDVPTRRGAIRDRQGVVLVRDVPCSRLELHYRTFRRRHPCGVALHCAELLGAPVGPYGEATLLDAFRRCLYAPLEALRRDAGAELARDRRYYLCALFAGLTDGPGFRGRFRVLSQRLIERLRRGAQGVVTTALELDAQRLEQVFRARLAELTALDRQLPERGGRLWGTLEATRLAAAKQRAAGSEQPAVERRPLALHQRLPYDLARDLASKPEWHPGLVVRPSVDRPVAEGLAHRAGSLDSLLGGVSPEWAEDQERRETMIEQVQTDLDEMAAADGELSEELRARVRGGLERQLNAHLMVHGRVGRTGVEADQDPVLRGIAGMQWVLHRRGAREVGLWSSLDVTPGEDVRLAIDLRLQSRLENALDAALVEYPKGQVAAAAVVDPVSGDVLALASRPRLADRPAEHKTDPALSWWTSGHIGSLAKPLVLLEHLDAVRHGRSTHDPRQFEACRGSEPMVQGDAKFKRFRLRCDHVHGELARDCVAALGESCNYFFYQVAEGLGWAGLQRAYARFGLWRPPRGASEPIPDGFQAHVAGIPAAALPDPSWDTTSRDLHRRAIGYGLSANVLHLARAYAGIATGRLPELSLVRRAPETLRSVALGVHPDDLALVREGLRYCVERGTAERLHLRGVLAKTGTAEVGQSKRNNAWLAGYVDGARPRLAFACVLYAVPHGRYGAAAAGPIAQRFLQAVQDDPKLAEEFR